MSETDFANHPPRCVLRSLLIDEHRVHTFHYCPLFLHSTSSLLKLCTNPTHTKMLSFSTAKEVKSAANATGAVFLDVRNDYEIQDSKLTSRPFLHVTCTPMDCSELAAKAGELLPNKYGKLGCLRPSHARGDVLILRLT